MKKKHDNKASEQSALMAVGVSLVPIGMGVLVAGFHATGIMHTIFIGAAITLELFGTILLGMAIKLMFRNG